MMNDAKDRARFKKKRARYKKKSISGTIVKERLDNIMSNLSGNFYAFGYLNETEKIDFMILIAEMLMVASERFPGMKTLDQIEADHEAQEYFKKYGKVMPPEMKIDQDAIERAEAMAANQAAS